MSSSPGSAWCLLTGTRHLLRVRQDSMRMRQPSVRKRKCLALFGTIGCRAQPISAQGCLERVPKRAKRFRLVARHYSLTRFVLTNSDWRAHRILDVMGTHRCWNSPLAAGACSLTGRITIQGWPGSLSRVPLLMCTSCCGKGITMPSCLKRRSISINRSCFTRPLNSG